MKDSKEGCGRQGSGGSTLKGSGEGCGEGCAEGHGEGCTLLFACGEVLVRNVYAGINMIDTYIYVRNGERCEEGRVVRCEERSVLGCGR